MEKSTTTTPTTTTYTTNLPKNTKGVLTVITVAGLPGVGKSTLFRNMINIWTNQYGYQVRKVESDVIRQTAIKLEKQKSEKRQLSALELEIKSKPVYTKMMNEEIREVIAELAEFDGKSVFILDKNYVPEDLREVIYEAARAHFENIKSFLILPQQSFDPELAMVLEGKESPFYIDILCASLIRCFSRKGHLSLCHGFSHSFKCIIGTLRSYLGQKFEDIAEKYDMEILYFDYFNALKLKEEPLRSIVEEKMKPVVQMVVEENYDGDKCAEILFEAEELTKTICKYDSHAAEYKRICGLVAGDEEKRDE